MDDAVLTKMWTCQVRAEVERFYGDVGERYASARRRTAEAGHGTPATPDELAQHVRDVVDHAIAQQLPFALTIGRESGATGPLTQEQLDRAGQLAVQQSTQDALLRFEERLQHAPETMTPQRRQFAESFLTLAKRHNALLDERLVNNDSPTEADLMDVSDQITRDIHELTRTLQRPSPKGGNAPALKE